MEQQTEPNIPVNPRRRKKTKLQIFKETYLPLLIIGVAFILILTFIIGSITRGIQKHKSEKEANLAASIALAEEQARLEEESSKLLAQAEEMAAGFDYEGAIALLKSFSGNLSDYPVLADKLTSYESAFNNTVEWNDPNQIPNLSFQLLIADPERGFSSETYGYSINRNFITTDEFSKILQQLYDNGYILVDYDDFIETEVSQDGMLVYKSKPLRLPNGKKPIMLTQTNVNYNYYLIDSNNDKTADANGCGFASKLVWNGSKFTCEMVDSSGNTITGDFDLVPILESFIEKHPDFSYRGARATLALTGYNGLFGYRTHAGAIEYFGEEAYNLAVQEATAVANALREHGYTLACYTYENISYESSSLTEIQADLTAWFNEVTPIIGQVDTLVYAQMSDISTDLTYSGEKYETLQNLGFRIYSGFSTEGSPWATITAQYVRQGRIMVTGTNLAYNSSWFTNLFDPSSVLNSSRGEVPQ